MKIANRSARTVLGATLKWRHYLAAVNMARLCDRPVDFFGRYALGFGAYPARVRLRSPSRPVELSAFTKDDILTINEIFCRLDYPARSTDRVFVDFGSNIGVSAAYFLSRNANSKAYLFEPLRQNLDRLKENLAPFDGRYELHEVAVGVADGTVEFGWEPTGRYGGVGLRTGRYIRVPCVDANSVIRSVIQHHGGIDVLKIDIESMQGAILNRIPRELLEKIDRIYVEDLFPDNPLAGTHHCHQYGIITQFTRIDGGSRAAAA
jgi:FkbM family methyltransferase